MKKTIEETTRLLLQGNLTKDEADKILLDLHNVINQRGQLAISGLKSVKAQTIEGSWANQIVVQYLIEIDDCL